jgi:hypothetical protein
MTGLGVHRITGRAPGRAARRVAVVAAVLCLGAAPALAQDLRPGDSAARPRFRTAWVEGGRIDLDRPVWRARYAGSPGALRVPAGLAASALADRMGEVFGGRIPAPELRAEHDLVDGPVRHLRYAQVVVGVPVLDRTVSVTLDRDGRVLFGLNGFDYDVSARPPVTRPVIGAGEAQRRARQELDGRGGKIGPATLVIVPGEDPRLAWRLYAWPEGPPSEWRVLVDAETGDVIGLQDETVRKSGTAPEAPTDRGLPEPGLPVLSTSSPADVTQDGRGAVFDPDPLATSGEAYIFPYTDQDDQDVPELNQERRPVTLRDITLGNDGLYRLDGPYVTIVGENSAGTQVYDPPKEPTSDGFSYTRANDGFEAVSAYHHVDLSQRHIQSLGFTDLQANPLPVNPSGTTADESGWIASLRYLFFGTGGVDDGEDAFVLWHEYAHAILEAGAPGLRASAEGRALHEGWSDYWAASYQRHLVETGKMTRTDWEVAFRWDAGDGTIWAGRTLDHSGTYPESTCSDNPNPGACSPHNDGRLWATVLMEIHQELGRDLTDRLNLLSHRYLSAPVTFRDAAEAVVQADIDYYGGEHLDVIVGRFAPRGLVDMADFWPTARHEPLPSIEETGSAITIDVEAIGYSAPIEEVAVVYRLGDGEAVTLALGPVGGNVWRGTFTGPAAPDSVFYWIRVTDAVDRSVLLPGAAPAAEFSFYVGPDERAPAIEHEPIDFASVAAWPPVVSARITDGLGVEAAIIEYSIVDPDGLPVDSGTFDLAPGEDDVWSAPFPVAVGSVRHGTVVRYALRATDASAAGNETRSPASGHHEFSVSGTGVLRRFTADSGEAGVTLSGSWEAGEPRYGVFASPLGESVWATAPEGATPTAATLSRLRLPALDLRGQEAVYLVFRHWYDTEHDGGAEPGKDAGAVLWDGGNVKLSTDGGATWTPAAPEGGWSGSVKSGEDNPLAGESAFGGYSYAWRQEIVPLPAVAGVEIAFDFGTDASNTAESIGFAGWYLDDVRVTTERPADATAPFVTDAPAARTVWPAGTAKPLVSIRVADDVGVSDVRVEYVWTRGSGLHRDTLRVPMSPYDVARFETTLDVGLDPRPDDRIELRFHIEDVSGNRITWPEGAGEWIVIDVMSLDVADMMATARPSGGWTSGIEGWTVQDSTGSLVLAPHWLAGNDRSVILDVVHHFAFGPGRGGRAEVSRDDGATWTPLVPEAGYPSTLDGKGVWDGQPIGHRTDRFDLGDLAGAAVQVRFSVVAIGSWSPMSWTIESAELVQQTGDDAFELPDAPILHANFPDPFAGSTNISVTLPESVPVSLAVYDVLGRQVAVLMDGVPAAGTHNLTFDASALTPGVYLLRLDAGGLILTERMVRAR